MKMATAQKRGLKRPVSADLVYHSIKYGCVKGGRAFKPRGVGLLDTRYVDFKGGIRVCRMSFYFEKYSIFAVNLIFQ